MNDIGVEEQTLRWMIAFEMDGVSVGDSGLIVASTILTLELLHVTNFSDVILYLGMEIGMEQGTSGSRLTMEVLTAMEGLLWLDSVCVSFTCLLSVLM